MREIKFRAWDKSKSKMFSVGVREFDLIEFPERFVIMQYTGLKDRNGKEIFEGDIVRFPPFLKYTGKDKAFAVEYSDYGEWCVGRFLLSRKFQRCEVIGNIYEDSTIK